MSTTWSRRLRIGVWTLAAGLVVPAAHGYDMNGFMPAAGEGALALSFSSEGYDEFWAGETKVSPPAGLGEVDTQSLTLWGRYGFTDRIAVVANLPYVDTEGDGLAGFEDSGISDLTALVQVRLADFGGGHSLTGAAGVRTDVGGYEGDAPVSLGDASTDALLRLVYQLQRGGFYFSQQVGYDLRGEDVPDGLPLHTELGYTFGRSTVNAFYTRYIADDGTDIGDPGFTFPSNQEDFERAGAKVYFRLGGTFGVTASAYTTLDGRNTGDSTGISVGGVFGL
jgi:hypothetical protein